MTEANGDTDQHAGRWDVALSFAGAQRDYVEQAAQALKARGVRCFYDADEQIELWGKYLAEELPAIYGERVAAVVVFVSAEYAARDWTRLERRAALNRAVRERREYVLPARFDDTPLPGLLSDMVAVDLRGRTPEQFAAMIAAKLAALDVTAPGPAVSPASGAGLPQPPGAVRVREADPRRLGVHAAISVPGVPDEGPPEYVPRDTDAAGHGVRAQVAAAAERGGFVLLVGGSSVGKTRCAAEAVKALLPDWWLVHPAGPAEAAALAQAPSRMVVWLDELQDYLDGEHGLTSAVIRALLNHPAVIIGTLWPDRYTAYTTGRASGGADPRARERQVLDLADVVRIAPAFSPAEQDRARAAAARDPRLQVALEASGYGLTQTLAAAPQLVARWEDAQTAAPYAWAVLTAALDVARLGARAPLRAEFLRAAAVDYCTSQQQAEAPDDWFEQALAYAAEKLHGAAAALSPVGAGVMGQVAGYTAADYLIQHTTRERRDARVPASTWDAGLRHIRDPGDTARLAWEASFAGRLEHVEKAFERAFAEREYTVAAELASCLGEAGREEQVIQLLEETIAAAEASRAVSAADLLDMRRLLVWHVGEKAGGHGDPERAEEIARRLIRDSTTVYGPAHPETLDARVRLARQVGAAGNPRQALTMARDADAAATAALGADDLATLSARFEVAVWTGEVDGAAAGAECFAELIQQAKRLNSPPWLLITDSMVNLAGCLSDAGHHTQAVQVSEEAISLGQQLWGAMHARVLWMRLGQAYVVGSSGDPQTAADLSGRLADDCAEVLGGTHLTTLEARGAVARWTAAAGDHQAAGQRYDALLADLARILGEDHWLTQQCRTELAEIKKT